MWSKSGGGVVVQEKNWVLLIKEGRVGGRLVKTRDVHCRRAKEAA